MKAQFHWQRFCKVWSCFGSQNAFFSEPRGKNFKIVSCLQNSMLHFASGTLWFLTLRPPWNSVIMLPILQIHQGLVRATILQVLFASFSQIWCGVYKNSTNIYGKQIAWFVVCLKCTCKKRYSNVVAYVVGIAFLMLGLLTSVVCNCSFIFFLMRTNCMNLISTGFQQPWCMWKETPLYRCRLHTFFWCNVCTLCKGILQ